MAHYDPSGSLGPHVRQQVDALAAAVDDLVVVSTAQLGEEERAWIEDRGRLIVRDNVGYDFYSYKIGLDSSGALGDHDEVIVCNDTYVGPLRSYADIFAGMAERPTDFWGFTRSERVQPHLQSFFLAFRPWLVQSRAFRRFWSEMTPISDRKKVIHRYEVGLTGTLAEAGFAWEPFVTESEHDARLARRRVQWWAARRRHTPRGRPDRAWWAEQARAPWNPSIALADVALDGGRMPFVKIDTLRYDPYGLNSERLLDLCEQRFPDAFAGVREFLAETAHRYPPRPEEQLHAAPALVRPLARLVEYGRAV